jgi:hypothetical protein
MHGAREMKLSCQIIPGLSFLQQGDSVGKQGQHQNAPEAFFVDY